MAISKEKINENNDYITSRFWDMYGYVPDFERKPLAFRNLNCHPIADYSAEPLPCASPAKADSLQPSRVSIANCNKPIHRWTSSWARLLLSNVCPLYILFDDRCVNL